jgi:tagatose-1,6-bisphosphate aldolase
MTQATDKEQTILDRIRSLTPQQQQDVLDFIEFLQFKARNREMEEEKKEPISADEAAKEFAGCVESRLSDLSHNKKYLEELSAG